MPIGGLIPAHAGKTHPRCNSSNPARAHPRSRGENGLHSIPIVRALGSSPRGRGKLRTSPRVHAGGGLIPARAGKTASPGTTCGLTWAYPRSRGENRRSGQEARFETGSSPRGRGKRGCDSGGRGHRGLIPTRAGKTRLRFRRARTPRAHPHAGGENAGVAACARAPMGSSPRGRGKHQPRRARHPRDGLIPTRAGKTRPEQCDKPRRGAHPHAGGENVSAGMFRSSMMGSSPRGRGKRSPYQQWRNLAWAHPRAGGENRRSR